MCPQLARWEGQFRDRHAPEIKPVIAIPGHLDPSELHLTFAASLDRHSLMDDECFTSLAAAAAETAIGAMESRDGNTQQGTGKPLRKRRNWRQPPVAAVHGA